MKYSFLPMTILGIAVSTVFGVLTTSNVAAQGLHFSQFFNAPMLTSPANAGLMSDKDFRVSANYRSQWGAVPVPFNTFAVQADLEVLPNREHTNWVGIGAAVFSDKSGDGNLAMTTVAGFLAYHLQLGETKMLSLGVSLASVQRSVDFTKLTFDAQWDGSDFNTSNSNNEKGLVGKANYADIGAGLNFASFPNENLYMKFGLSVAHLNRPRESFLNESNSVGMRTTGNIDVLYKLNSTLIVNPSIYYTMQHGASELMYGGLAFANLGGMDLQSHLIGGLYQRWNDAIVFVAGYEWKGIRLMGSYDYTTSTLAQYINHNGAFEFCLRWAGFYKNQDASTRKMYQCPRF